MQKRWFYAFWEELVILLLLLFIPVMQDENSDKELPNAAVQELDKAAKKDQDSV